LSIDDQLQPPFLLGSQWQPGFDEESLQLLNRIVTALKLSQRKVAVGKDRAHSKFPKNTFFGILSECRCCKQNERHDRQVTFHSPPQNALAGVFLQPMYT